MSTALPPPKPAVTAPPLARIPNFEGRSVPYSVFYFIAVSLNALSLGFLPLFLQDCGYSPTLIAAVSAASTVATIFATPVIQHLAYHLHSAAKLFTVTSALGVLAYLPLLTVGGVLTWPAYAVTVLWMCSQGLRRAADSLVDVQVLRDSTQSSIRFEKVRVWGSVGFVLVAFAFGLLTDRLGVRAVPFIGAVIVLSIGFASRPLANFMPTLPGAKHRDDQATDSSPTAPSDFILIVSATALSWMSHGVLYVYLSVYLRELGWTGSEISLAWNIGVLAEVILFFRFKQLEEQLGLVRVFQLSLALTAVRWIILAATTNKLAIMSSQLLHAFSFGGCYLASIKLVHERMPRHSRDRAQGTLASIGVGFGSLLGRLFAGLIASHCDNYGQLWIGFALCVIAALSSVICSLFVR